MSLEAITGEVTISAAVIPVVTTLVGLVAGLALALWLGPKRGSAAQGAARPDREGQDEDLRDLRKTVSLLQHENKHLSTFLLTLPDLARQLNSSNDRRNIPQLMIRFIEQLFEAEQILVFLSVGDGRSLRLAAGKGIPEGLRATDIIPFGRGRVGLAAELGIVMDEREFVEKTRLARSEGTGGDAQQAASPLPFRTDLAAPLIAGSGTMGVISLGGLLRRPKNEKNMLKMVADFGSIAIQSSMLLNTIQASANTDGLTGLSNKKFFMGQLAQALLDAEKNHQNLSLFIFDIDHFKVYNDTNGHLAGDDALKLTGRLIQQHTRNGDTAARYGGEEFVVLLPGTEKEGALAAAEKIRAAVEAFAYPLESSQPLGKVTISGGVATYPYDATTTADLIRCADQALYKGKRAGRNRIFAHEPVYLSEDLTDTALKIPGASQGQ